MSNPQATQITEFMPLIPTEESAIFYKYACVISHSNRLINIPTERLEYCNVARLYYSRRL